MQRLESSRLGRLALSLFAVSAIGLQFVHNLPAGELRERLRGVDPVARALGMDQSWSVFADPYRIKVIVEVRIRYRNGGTGRWTVPRGDPLIGANWDYRWRKWEEELRQDRYSNLWRPAAEYVARREREQGRDPVRVTLVRRWYDLEPPGPGPDRGPWQQFAFYTLDLSPGSAR